jgi:membrane-bound lytic murein transglycosylase A
MLTRSSPRFYAAALVALLSACTSVPETGPQPRPTVPAKIPSPPPTAGSPGALSLPLTLPGAASSLAGWQADDAAGVATALRKSCPALQKRPDASGLTQPSDWGSLCGALAAGNPALDIKALLAAELMPVQVADGRGLNTGYYEAQLDGALQPGGPFTIPLYKRPPELVEVELGTFRPAMAGQRLAGKVVGKMEGARLVPFADRAAIAGGALKDRHLELLWVNDEWEAYSLHIQGSGQIRLPDGRMMRVGYDGQNGHEYQSVGKLMIQRGLMQKGQATMQGILAWARANPAQGRSLFNENKSFIFFKEIKGEGPIGALNIALTPERSIAVDPLYVPLGAPVWLDSSHQDPQAIGRQQLPFRGVRVAQDTGGAIKGPNRLDIFFGFGPRATLLAGAQTATGTLTLLLPRSSVARLIASGKLASR